MVSASMREAKFIIVRHAAVEAQKAAHTQKSCVSEKRHVDVANTCGDYWSYAQSQTEEVLVRL